MKAMLLLFMISFGAYAQVKTYGTVDMSKEQQIKVTLLKANNKITNTAEIELTNGKRYLADLGSLPESISNTLKNVAIKEGFLKYPHQLNWTLSSVKPNGSIGDLALVDMPTALKEKAPKKYASKILVEKIKDDSASLFLCPNGAMDCHSRIQLSNAEQQYPIDMGNIKLQNTFDFSGQPVSVVGYITDNTEITYGWTSPKKVFKVISLKYLKPTLSEGNLQNDVRVINLSRNDAEIKETNEINLSRDGEARRTRQPAIIEPVRLPSHNPNVINN